MKIISFAWTTPALIAGRKSVTRREWTDEYAKRFKPGDICQAWNKQPRFKGAKRVGYIVIISVTKENIHTMPDSDYEAEGFRYLEEQGKKIWGYHPIIAFGKWKNQANIPITSDDVWVVRFKWCGETLEGRHPGLGCANRYETCSD